MGLFAEWRESRDRQRRAASYLEAVARAGQAAQGDWLIAMGVPPETAVHEITLAVRAIGLIVAQRDALDDRTAADVAHQLAPLLEREAQQPSAQGAAWGERWRAYTAALAVRGNAEVPAARLAKVLLHGAGLVDAGPEQLARATAFVADVRSRANEALRDLFGVVDLPDDIRPSALGH
jgi:hypothetical protein